jgi:hypothetical protein
MKNELVNAVENKPTKQIVIPDECGDSMWDAVLGQEEKACQLNKVEKDLAVLFDVIQATKQTDENQVVPCDQVKV